MATAATYCTHKELKRVFPQLDSFDNKKSIYGWKEVSSNKYAAHNSGIVSQLFADGEDLGPAQSAHTVLNVEGEWFYNSTDDVLYYYSASDIIKIANEYMRIVSVSTNEITVSTPATNRGLFGSSAGYYGLDVPVYKVIDVVDDVHDSVSATPQALGFVYDSELDLCLLTTLNTDPNDYLVEAGEDFTTLVTQFRSDASRYLDSMLDPNMPKEALKDKEGNFDYIIIRSSALIAANFMIKSHDPNSELANALMEEAEKNISNINEGKAALSWQVTRDSSQGIIRDVSYTSGAIRPVDTRGEWSGTYDPLAGGLEIRFAGGDDATVAAANDEWEIEVFGRHETVDASSGKAVKMTRTRKI